MPFTLILLVCAVVALVSLVTFCWPLPEFGVRWLIRRARRTPYWHLDGYMERFWLLGGEARETRPYREDWSFYAGNDRTYRSWRRGWLDRLVGRFVAVRVHHILRSDDDRAMHDHPWANATVVLRGSVMEVRPADPRQHPYHDARGRDQAWAVLSPGSVVLRNAEARHRLVVDPSNQAEGCWTLFIMLGKKREWGFHTEQGWIRHETYFRKFGEQLDAAPAPKCSTWNTPGGER